MPERVLFIVRVAEADLRDYRKGIVIPEELVAIADMWEDGVREVPDQPPEKTLREAVQALLNAANQFAMPDETWDAYAADLAARLRAMGEGPQAEDYEAALSEGLAETEELQGGERTIAWRDGMRWLHNRAAQLARERSEGDAACDT
jgi:hypothetical protein